MMEIMMNKDKIRHIIDKRTLSELDSNFQEMPREEREDVREAHDEVADSIFIAPQCGRTEERKVAPWHWQALPIEA